MIVGVVQFPGTNCELDVIEVVGALGGCAQMATNGWPPRSTQ
jgi:phosphoribosylformylglycinamidine (FGAM) synthase-like amidotransferase family enzyme